jgi:hypothetical protein
VQGAYRFIGPRTTKNVFLALFYDPSGVAIATARATSIEKWSADFSFGEGTTELRMYGLNEDPLDPQGGTVLGNSVFSERRLEVPHPRPKNEISDEKAGPRSGPSNLRP